MLKLKLQYFGHLMWRTDSLEKTNAGKDWRWEEKGAAEDKIVKWHHWLNGHEFEQTPGDSGGQRSLASGLGSQIDGHNLATEQQVVRYPTPTQKEFFCTQGSKHLNGSHNIQDSGQGPQAAVQRPWQRGCSLTLHSYTGKSQSCKWQTPSTMGYNLLRAFRILKNHFTNFSWYSGKK